MADGGIPDECARQYWAWVEELDDDWGEFDDVEPGPMADGTE